jgi:hypothetical protein
MWMSGRRCPREIRRWAICFAPPPAFDRIGALLTGATPHRPTTCPRGARAPGPMASSLKAVLRYGGSLARVIRGSEADTPHPKILSVLLFSGPSARRTHTPWRPRRQSRASHSDRASRAVMRRVVDQVQLVMGVATGREPAVDHAGPQDAIASQGHVRNLHSRRPWIYGTRRTVVLQRRVRSSTALMARPASPCNA